MGGGGEMGLVGPSLGSGFCWLAFLPPKTFGRLNAPPRPRDGGRSSLRSLRSGMADGGGPTPPLSRSFPFPALSDSDPVPVPEKSAVMSSDFFLRPAHARLSRFPALEAELGAGESGGGLGAAGRACPWPWLWP